jgi:uncharacterized sodium:solute symporter family permease YidK
MDQQSKRKCTLCILAIFITTITFLFFAFIFAAAYTDYGFRSCPDAVQCDDAISTMIVAGLFMIATSTLFGIAWFFNIRRKQRG